MRILHLVTYPLFSGPVPPTVGLAIAQRAMGHTVWVAVDRKRGHLEDPYEEPAAPAIAAAKLTAPVPLTLSTHATPMQYLRDARQLRALVRDRGVDVVHAHQSHDHGLLAWLGAGAPPRVRTLHAARSLRRRLGQRWLLQHCDGIIVRCRAHLDALVSTHAPRVPVAVMAGSIDAARFAPPGAARGGAARAAWNIPAQVPLIGMVALLAGRGQAELLAAVARADARVHVLLAGRGSEESSLRALAQRLGLAERTHFVGYLQGDLLMNAYAACDAMFLSRAGNDAGARAGLEAMAAGVPLIAVAHDALADLVDDERGFVVPSNDPADIAAALARWLACPARAARTADVARSYVGARRSFAEEAAATLRFYGRLRATHTNAPPG